MADLIPIKASELPLVSSATDSEVIVAFGDDLARVKAELFTGVEEAVIPQNNVRTYKEVSYTGSAPNPEQVALLINAIPSFTISETQLFSFNVLPNSFGVNLNANPEVSKYDLVKVGKGSYGVGGVVLTKNNLELKYQQKIIATDIENLTTTQIFNFGIIGPTTISQYVNSRSPFTIQNQNIGYRLFKADGKTYLFTGVGGTYGTANSQTTDANFELFATINPIFQADLAKKLDKVTTAGVERFYAVDVNGVNVMQPISNIISNVGSQYILVKSIGTDVQNANELLAAYNLAKTKGANTNKRITIIAYPANYNFTTIDFLMNTQYIDLVSLDGNRSIVFNGVKSINVTASDVFVKGVDVLAKPFTIASDLDSLKIDNCRGGNNSFGSFGDTASGTFTNCEAGDLSFGVEEASGTFINCKGGVTSFGSDIASGVFTNCDAGTNSFGESVSSGFFNDCKAGEYSFGGDTASGTYNNCTSGYFSFGNVLSSGNFTNCKAGNNSFGGQGSTASGNFKDCTAGDYSFGENATGVFENCEAGGSSFGNSDASGIFDNCTAKTLSFGGDGGEASGSFTNCKAGSTSFGATALGTFTNCISGNNSFGELGALGVFSNCIGGNNSFGYTSTLSGKLYYCRLTSGTFRTVSSGGKTVYCIDGNNNTNNQ